MEPEPVSKSRIEQQPPSSPPQPPPPPSSSTQPEATANAPVSGGRRNLSFSWSSSSSSTSSFNSLVDSFKKDDINIHDEPQQQPTPPPQLSLGASSSSRFGVYDPNRIPSSIFAKPSNQADWSVASNESLFSIHTGNNSFSLGEFALPNFESINNYPQAAAAAPEPENRTSNNPFGVPVTAEEEFQVEEYGRKSSSIWLDFHEINDPPPAITQPPVIVVTEKEECPPAAAAASPGSILLLESCSNVSDQRQSFSAGSPRMSEESGNSCNSFAFPLLTSDGSTNDHLSQAPPASMGTENERLPPPQHSPKRESNANANSGPQPTTAEWGGNEAPPPPPENNSSWFSYFCCCSRNCHCCGRANCLSNGNNTTNEKLDT